MNESFYFVQHDYCRIHLRSHNNAQGCHRSKDQESRVN